MSLEQKIFSAEEMEKMQKERTLNDAELIKGGAEYKAQASGDLRLEATSDQIENGRREMETFLNNTEIEKRLAEAKDIDSIIGIVDRLEGGMQGSKQFYDSRTLKEMLTRVKNGSLETRYITNTCGLRDAVIRVFGEQKMELGAQKDLLDFTNFVSKNESLLAQMSYEEIEDYIYNDFYNNGEKREFESGDEKTEATRQLYNREVVKMRNEIEKEINTNLGRDDKSSIRIWQDGGWTACSTIDGISTVKNEGIGRLYLNIKPGEVIKVFKEGVHLFADMNLSIQMKIPSQFNTEGSGHILNRQDKMVIYFAPGDEEKIFDALDRLYNKYRSVFLSGKPRFTAELKDSQGNIMEGVGFAEEPKFKTIRNRSFGAIRSAILCEIIKKGKAQRKPLKDLNFVNHFKSICEEYQVNALHPAFNSGSQRLRQTSPIFQRLFIAQ